MKKYMFMVQINILIILYTYSFALAMEPKKCVTLFYPGNMAESAIQCSKYVDPKKGLQSYKTEEIIRCKNGLELIKRPFINSDIGDTRPLGAVQHSWYQFHNRILDYVCFLLDQQSKKNYGVTVESLPEKSSPESLQSYSVNPTFFNLGQSLDLHAHRKRYEACLKECGSETPQIHWGVSRGAFTTLIAQAQNNYENVEALILEGCGDNLEHVLQEQYPSVPQSILKIFYSTGSKFTHHKPDGLSPLKVVNRIPKNKAIAFITSLKDETVPAACTKNLVKQLVQEGHTHIYLLVLQNSSHARYVMDDPEDRKKYDLFIRGFNKKYNIQPDLWPSQEDEESALEIVTKAQITALELQETDIQ